MKSLKSFLILIIVIFVSSSCAHDVNADFGGEVSDKLGTGTLEVTLTEPMSDVTVLVNGKIVALKKSTERVTVRNIPSGDIKVEVSASEFGSAEAVEKKETFNIKAGETKTVTIAAPGSSSRFWIRSILLIFLSF